MNDRERAIAAEMRMRIDLRHAAMRRPARVRQSCVALRLGQMLDRVHFVHAADVFAHFDAGRRQHGKAAGVVAAILKIFNAPEEPVGNIRMTDYANNSTHRCFLLQRDVIRNKSPGRNQRSRRKGIACSNLRVIANKRA